MTEKEWLTCTDSWEMVAGLRLVGATARKLRLFAVACCDWREDWLPDRRSRETVQVAALFADGNAGESELATAHADAEASFRHNREAYAAVQVTAPDAWVAAQGVAEWPDYLGWDSYE